MVGGGSGMQYELGWDDAAADDDNVVESQRAGVRGQPQRALIAGSEIDYVDNNMLGAGFAIKNPNVKSRAGGRVAPVPAAARRNRRTLA